MTLPEIARDLWNRYGLNFPGEDQISKEYRIGSERAGRALSILSEISFTESVAMFGRPNLEPVKEWQR